MGVRASIRDEKGFTLVELMVAAVIAVIVVGGAYGMFITMKTANVNNKSDMEMQQNVRAGIGQVTRLLSNAGYQGSFNFSAYSSVARGIVYHDDSNNVVTNSNSICFTFYDEDRAFWGKLPNGYDKERRITIYQSGNQILSKMECFNDPTPSIHQFVQVPNKPVVLANNISNLSFQYFDANSTEINPITKDNVTQIMKVRVTVTGNSSLLDYIAGVFKLRPKRFSLSSDITPVNLGIAGHAVDTTPPAAPTGLKVRDPHVCYQLVASWNASPEVDLAGYRLYWGADSNYDHMKDVGNVTSYTLTGLANGTNYHVTVCAYDKSGNVSVMATDVFTGDANGDDTTPNPVPPPRGPINLHATAGPLEGQITLAWDTDTINDPDVTSYWVYRKVIADPSHVAPFCSSYPISTLSSQPPSGITQVVSAANFSTKVSGNGSHYAFTDSGLTGCVMYEYAVVPINCDPTLVSQYTQTQCSIIYGNGVDVGSPSVSANAVTVPTDSHPPHQPSGLVGIPGSQTVFLSWTNPNDDDFKGVRVMRSTYHYPTSVNDGDLVVNDTTDGKGQSATFADANLTNGTCYFYTAFAYDNCFNNSSGICSVNANGQVTPACSKPCSAAPYGLPPAPPKTSYTASYCSQKVNIGWSDPPNIAQYPDIIGYNIYRSDNGATPIKQDFKGVGSFNIYSDTDYPSDGGTYAYSIKTVDCSNNLSDPADIVNITAYPGQVYYDPSVATTSMGLYSDWLQFNTANSSAYQAKLQGVTITWSGNNTETNAYLSKIYIWDGTNFVQVYGGQSGQPVSSGTPIIFNNAIQLPQALPSGNGLSAPSTSPMQFQWTNSDGTVTSADDMRRASVTIQYNYVLYYFNSYDNNFHESNPQLAGCIVQTYDVARPYAPTFLDVTQNQPLPATFAQTQTGLILIPPDKLTDVSTYVVDTTPNLVGIKYVKLFYAFTNRTSTTPPTISTDSNNLEAVNRWTSSNPRGFIPMTTIPVNPGNDLIEYKTTFKNRSTINGHPIPSYDSNRIWYFLLAKDNNGSVTRWPMPAPVDQAFNYDQLPGAGGGGGPSVTASVVYPTAGTTVSGTVKVQVSAISANPGVSMVQIYIDGVAAAGVWLDSGTGTWDCTWDTTKGVANGPHSIYAVATAGTMTVTSTTVNCTVNNGAVTASFVSPTDGTTANGTWNVEVQASDTGPGITGVAFYVDNVLQGPMQPGAYWTFTWNTSGLTGSHTLMAVATNANSQTATAYANNVTVYNGNVTISMSPANGTTVSTNSYPIYASAVDTGGASIVSMTISIDGTQVATSTSGSISYVWDTTKYSNATHTITVKATNSLLPVGVQGTQTNNVTVDNSVVNVNISNPGDGNTVNGTVPIQATASTSGSSHIASMQIYIGALGVPPTQVASSGSGSISYSWLTSSLVNGTKYAITVIATDNKGHSASQSVIVTVDNGTVTVNISAPTPGQTVTGTQTISASANSTVSPITSAQLTITDTSTNTSTTTTIAGAGPYTVPWNTTTLTNNHVYSITITATNGNETGSKTVSVTVDNGTVNISIVNPQNGSTVFGTQQIQATVSSALGNGTAVGISTVTVIVTNTSTHTSTSYTMQPGTPSWYYNWDTTQVANGTYTITVVAKNANNQTGSSTNTVTVDNTAVTCAVITPVNGEKVTGTYTINIAASTNPSRAIDHVYVQLDKSGTWIEITSSYNSSTGYWYYNWDMTGFGDNTPHYVDAYATSLTKTVSASEVSCTKVTPPTISMNELTYCATSGGTYTTKSPTPTAGAASSVPKGDYIKWYVNVTAPAGLKSVTLSESTNQSSWTGVAMTLSSTGVYYNSTPRQMASGSGKSIYYKFTVTDNNNISVTIPGVAGTYYWVQTQ